VALPVSPLFAYGETVTVLSRELAEPDADGNDVYSDTEVDVPNVAVLPMDANATAGNEQDQGRDTVIVGLSLLMPPGTVVRATDRIRVRGRTYEVTGEPVEMRSPLTGTDAGLSVALKDVTG
jgi:hypothetical protein